MLVDPKFAKTCLLEPGEESSETLNPGSGQLELSTELETPTLQSLREPPQ